MVPPSAMFPFKSAFAKPVQFYLDNLRDDAKHLQVIRPVKVAKFKFPVKFVSSPAVYDQINLVTDLFTEPARMKASVYGQPSPMKYWEENEAKIRTYALETWGKDDVFSLREAIYFLTKEATAFSPAISKLLYQTLLPKGGGTVFDPFSGWGDRAIGAVCCPQVTKYVGVDCNPDLKDGYDQIVKLSDKVTFNQMSITEFKTDETFDLVFSSPPFWDYEVYNTQDPKQSITGIKSYSQWFSEFMTPVLHQLVSLTKKGGYIALYVGATYRTKSFPDDIWYVLTKEAGCRYVQRIDCSVEDKRPVPIHVFQK